MNRVITQPTNWHISFILIILTRELSDLKKVHIFLRHYMQDFQVSDNPPDTSLPLNKCGEREREHRLAMTYGCQLKF